MQIWLRIGLMMGSAFVFYTIFNKVSIHEKIVPKYKLDSFFRNTFFHIVIYFALSFAAITIEYFARGGNIKTTYTDIVVGGIVIASMVKTIDIVNKNRMIEKKNNKSKSRNKKKKKRK